jgi:hypothetical protein
MRWSLRLRRRVTPQLLEGLTMPQVTWHGDPRGTKGRRLESPDGAVWGSVVASLVDNHYVVLLRHGSGGRLRMLEQDFDNIELAERAVMERLG